MDGAAWWDVVVRIIDATHAASGADLPRVVADAVAPLGMAASLYLVDHGQRRLALLPHGEATIALDGTLAGRAYQYEQVLVSTRLGHPNSLWVPLVDGTERIGLLRLDLPSGIDGHDPDLQRSATVLGGLLGHVVAGKFVYGDSLLVRRRTTPFTPAAELLWQLLPPLTFASHGLVISAIVEPHDRVGGDAFDYAVEEDRAFVALFDGVGHDMQAGLTTAVAMAAIRHARRAGERDLNALARRADEEIVANRGTSHRFVAAVLAWIDTRTGAFTHLVAGHAPPILLRANRTVKTLANGPRVPLGVLGGPPVRVGREQLEPGDRLLLHTDGISEARDDTGRQFGTRRLLEFAEHSSAAGLPAPETLRRLSHAVLEHQHGRFQDDATLLMVDWRPAAPQRVPIGSEQVEPPATRGSGGEVSR